jgi:nicotinate phosphoribosyltransferase
MYNPQSGLLNVVRLAFPLQMLPFDMYFLRMAEADFLLGRQNIFAVKSYFVRSAPFGGSYVLLGGLVEALRTILDLRLDIEDFRRALTDLRFDEDFIKYMVSGKHLRVQVFAPETDGAIFFPHEPIVSVRGSLPHLRLVDSIITEAMNFPSLSITKWHRFNRSIRPGNGLEFSRRRAQNARRASLYGMIGGCFATSNADLRCHADVRLIGTMGHEMMQSFSSVQEAFDAWLRVQPMHPVGLVDTKQCLEHDFPAWLDAVYRHKDAIKKANPVVWGWRNDSGDLASLTIEQHRRFLQHPLAGDEWFRERQVTVLTNELDEISADAINRQIYVVARAAGFDHADILKRITFAAGTKPGVCYDSPALGAVMKLVEVDDRPSLKLAFDAEGRVSIKTSIPGFNMPYWIYGDDGSVCTLIAPVHRYRIDEQSGKLYDIVKGHVVEHFEGHHPDPGSSRRVSLSSYKAVGRVALVLDTVSEVSVYGEDWMNVTISEVAARAFSETDALPWQMTRLEQPEVMGVYLTPDLFDLRKRMIAGGHLVSEYTKF